MKSRNMDFILRKTLKLYYHFGVYTKSGKYPSILDILCQTCFDIKYQVNKTVFAKTVLTLYANFILRIAQRGMGKCELPHN